MSSDINNISSSASLPEKYGNLVTKQEPRSTAVPQDGFAGGNPSKTTCNRTEISEDVSLTFPQRLMEVLDDEAHSDAIAWLPHGRGFIIRNKDKFVENVLPLYFNHSKLPSFTRKLNRWGFVRVTRGEECGSYYHRQFQRGKHGLCHQMSCRKACPAYMAGTKTSQVQAHDDVKESAEDLSPCAPDAGTGAPHPEIPSFSPSLQQVIDHQVSTTRTTPTTTIEFLRMQANARLHAQGSSPNAGRSAEQQYFQVIPFPRNSPAMIPASFGMSQISQLARPFSFDTEQQERLRLAQRALIFQQNRQPQEQTERQMLMGQNEDILSRSVLFHQLDDLQLQHYQIRSLMGGSTSELQQLAPRGVLDEQIRMLTNSFSFQREGAEVQNASTASEQLRRRILLQQLLANPDASNTKRMS